MERRPSTGQNTKEAKSRWKLVDAKGYFLWLI
jgi:hypothetical protein